MKTYSPILYAEDDANDAFFLKHAFQTAGITNALEIAQNGRAAIDYLSGSGPFADRTRYPVPCLMLLDLKMPDMSGMEVLEWLRHESPLRSLPVIILTSSAHPADVERAYCLGANAFVVKPVSVPERTRLAEAIREFWLGFTEILQGS